MKFFLENDNDFESTLSALKEYMLSRTDTIAIRKDAKIALNKLSLLNDIINAERNV